MSFLNLPTLKLRFAALEIAPVIGPSLAIQGVGGAVLKKHDGAKRLPSKRKVEISLSVWMMRGIGLYRILLFLSACTSWWPGPEAENRQEYSDASAIAHKDAGEGVDPETDLPNMKQFKTSHEQVRS